MEAKEWKSPQAPDGLRLTSSESRLYNVICKDLFDTFEALKKTLDNWETEHEPGNVFMKAACKIPVLIDEMTQTTKNKRFAAQVVRQVYCMVFSDDRPVHANLPPPY